MYWSTPRILNMKWWPMNGITATAARKPLIRIESVRDNKFWINVARVDNTLGDRKLLPTRYGKFE